MPNDRPMSWDGLSGAERCSSAQRLPALRGLQALQAISTTHPCGQTTSLTPILSPREPEKEPSAAGSAAAAPAGGASGAWTPTIAAPIAGSAAMTAIAVQKLAQPFQLPPPQATVTLKSRSPPLAVAMLKVTPKEDVETAVMQVQPREQLLSQLQPGDAAPITDRERELIRRIEALETAVRQQATNTRNEGDPARENIKLREEKARVEQRCAKLSAKLAKKTQCRKSNKENADQRSLNSMRVVRLDAGDLPFDDEETETSEDDEVHAQLSMRYPAALSQLRRASPGRYVTSGQQTVGLKVLGGRLYASSDADNQVQPLDVFLASLTNATGLRSISKNSSDGLTSAFGDRPKDAIANVICEDPCIDDRDHDMESRTATTVTPLSKAEGSESPCSPGASPRRAPSPVKQRAPLVERLQSPAQGTHGGALEVRGGSTSVYSKEALRRRHQETISPRHPSRQHLRSPRGATGKLVSSQPAPPQSQLVSASGGRSPRQLPAAQHCDRGSVAALAAHDKRVKGQGRR